MSKDWNWRKGRWETDTETEAIDLKKEQPEPVFLLNRKTNTYKEYKIPVKVRDLTIKHGKLVRKDLIEKDDIWE